MIESCNHDCKQGRYCYCAWPRRLSCHSKVWLVYLVCVALAVFTAIGMSILLAPGA
jgi:hypothetical protein